MVDFILMVLDMSFGKGLSTLRKIRGLTQEKMSGLIGLTKL